MRTIPRTPAWCQKLIGRTFQVQNQKNLRARRCMVQRSRVYTYTVKYTCTVALAFGSSSMLLRAVTIWHKIRVVAISSSNLQHTHTLTVIVLYTWGDHAAPVTSDILYPPASLMSCP
ncbi:hypothetical protein DAEQUDRAFT_383791 [Daedalea quercina L-15889]|uniref:Uncharacterized protein n=1 Tax=Daedalea quercina L-15889 TaxID=1314783 RepID=A0A165P0Q8_9APHY|nr:hypothetical protein DAEQUDRAFT_383791 [Daedalea quercina L-15889]